MRVVGVELSLGQALVTHLQDLHEIIALLQGKETWNQAATDVVISHLYEAARHIGRTDDLHTAAPMLRGLDQAFVVPVAGAQDDPV